MALQDPRQKRVGPFSVDDGSAQLMPRAVAPAAAAPLPAIPGAVRPPSGQPKAFEGARQFASFMRGDAGRAVPTAPGPITDATPASVLKRVAGNTRFNFAPDKGNGASWQNSPGGPSLYRPTPGNLLRPTTGPLSADSAARLADVQSTLAPMSVPNIAPKPMLARPDGSVTTAPSVAGALTNIAGQRSAGGAVASDPRNYDPAADNISAANLAAVTQITKPAPTGGTDVVGADGKPRHLNYGAMINGVPTFSDGTGGPDGRQGSIPNTMTPEAMAQLAKAPSIGRADVGALGTALASDALGGTATQEQMIGQRMAQLAPAGSRPSAEMFAASDRNAIALRDPRSAAGIAAHNLDMEAQYARTPRARRIAEQGIAQLTRDAGQSGLLAQQQHGQEASDYTQGQNQLANTELQGKNTLANTALEQRAQLLKPRAGQQVTLADGTLGVQDTTTGVVTPSKLTDGTTAKAQVTRDDTATKRTQALIDQLNKGVQEQMKSFLPSKDAPEPTPQMISQWRSQQAMAMNMPIAANPKTGERVVNVNGQWMPL